MKSLTEQIKALYKLIDSADLSKWQNGFVKRMWKKTNGGLNCNTLNDKQIEVISRMFEANFGQGGVRYD